MSSGEKQLTRFKMLEEDGRQRAYDRDSIPKNDSAFLEDIMVTARTMRNELREDSQDEKSRLPSWVAMVATYTLPIAEHCEGAKIARKDCLITEKSSSDYLRSLIREMDNESRKILQKRCTFLFGEVEPYNLSSCINDITACYHRSLELYSDVAGKWQKEGKCKWRTK